MAILNGTTGNDTIYGSTGNDELNGKAGNDLLYGGTGNDSIYGGAGNDWSYGEDGNDHIYDSDGTANFIDGGGGNDSLYGSFGNDTILGGAGGDLILASGGHDVLTGGGGNDTITTGPGADTIHVDVDTDTIIDLSQQDTLHVSAGATAIAWDILNFTGYNVANNGTVRVTGTVGADIIVGTGGVDLMTGGTGNDVMTGGAGADRFVFAVNTTLTRMTVTTTQTQTFADWLAPQDLNLNQLTQSQFSTQYTAWLEHMVATHPSVGADVNGDGVIAIGMNQNDPAGLPTIEGMTAAQVGQYFNDSAALVVQTGKTTQERYLAKQFSTSTTEEVTVVTGSSPDGHDTLTDFVAGQDTLVLQLPTELTLAQVKSLLAVSVVDADGDGALDDTRIAFAHAPDDGSVTLLGVTSFSMDSIVAA